MFGSLRTRQKQVEWMDEPGADPAALDKSLKYIRTVNRLLGYDALVVQQLARFSAKWDKNAPIRILDVGTGSADIPLAVLRWAERAGFDVRIVGIDLHARIVESARLAASREPKLRVVRGDALQLPFADGTFDYALTSMFLHHLEEADVTRTLAEMDRVARRGVVVSDLLRQRRAYAFITLATLLASPMVRHDARASVAQAFTRPEILALRDRAGATYAEYFEHLTHRFVLAGEK